MQRGERGIGSVLNNAPEKKGAVYVFGKNDRGQLGLGHTDSVTQPTINPLLPQGSVGVVQVAAGGYHCVALTRDNKILTWGDNTDAQLGRNTQPGGNGAEVDFSDLNLPKDTVFTQVVATESASFVLTEFGNVYGWGTFREVFTTAQGVEKSTTLGFRPQITRQHTPVHIPELQNVQRLAAGSQHILAQIAIDANNNNNGDDGDDNKPEYAVYAWGANKRGQLGYQVAARQPGRRAGAPNSSLVPRLCALPESTKYDAVVSIGAGSYHSFVTKIDGTVYAWGYNKHGQTGIHQGVNLLQHDSIVPLPVSVNSLSREQAWDITGGDDHSIAITSDNRCMSWGSLQSNVLGIDQNMIAAANVVNDNTDPNNPRPAILKQPTLVPRTYKCMLASAGPGHSIAVTRRVKDSLNQGIAHAWGSNKECEVKDSSDSNGVNVPHAVNGGKDGLDKRSVIGAAAGKEFSVLLAD
ncbi:regulator of chromosome condensation 1/beta-lactamase-inhibitor protein II [Aspergillus unguis]